MFNAFHRQSGLAAVLVGCVSLISVSSVQADPTLSISIGGDPAMMYALTQNGNTYKSGALDLTSSDGSTYRVNVNVQIPSGPTFAQLFDTTTDVLRTDSSGAATEKIVITVNNSYNQPTGNNLQFSNSFTGNLGNTTSPTNTATVTNANETFTGSVMYGSQTLVTDTEMLNSTLSPPKTFSNSNTPFTIQSVTNISLGLHDKLTADGTVRIDLVTPEPATLGLVGLRRRMKRQAA